MNNIMKYSAFALIAIASLAMLVGATSTKAITSTTVSTTSTVSSTTTTTIPSNNTTVTACGTTVRLVVGDSVKCDGYKVKLQDLGQPNANGISPADFDVYYHGVLTNATVMFPPSTQEINDSLSGAKNLLYINLNSTFDGLYASERWANVSITPICIPGTSLKCLDTVYADHNTSYDNFTIHLFDLGQPGANGLSPANLGIYFTGTYNGTYYSNVLTNVTQMHPGQTHKFTVFGETITIHVNSTFAGLYVYQRWAKLGYKISPA